MMVVAVSASTAWSWVNLAGCALFFLACGLFARALRLRSRAGGAPESAGSRGLGIGTFLSLGTGAWFLISAIKGRPFFAPKDGWSMPFYFFMIVVATLGGVFARRPPRRRSDD